MSKRFSILVISVSGLIGGVILAVILGEGILWDKSKSGIVIYKHMGANNHQEASLAAEQLKEKISPIIMVRFQTTEVPENSGIAKKADEIKARNFELVGMPDNTLTFGEALQIAKFVDGIGGIRPAFLLAILQEELTLEKYDLGYLTNLSTGQGVRFSDGKKMRKMMHPQRDIPGFLAICKELKKDPLKTLVTCPMSFGWGGAMGPADFIPSTWLSYKDDVERITGKPADPWNIIDAFLASGFFLSDSGAGLKTRKGEWRAAMIYFSGSPDSGYNWYADSVLAIADKLETDIETIEKSY